MSPASPCRAICRLDDADICVGCGRSRAEIVDWAGRSEGERRAIRARAAARLADRGMVAE